MLFVTMSLLAGCQVGSESQESVSKGAPPSLTGEWVAVDRDGSSPQVAGIGEESIVIEWTLDDDLSGLYWAGTFNAPKDNGDFTWTSSAYTDVTESAILASGLDQKVFSYDDGFLIYEISYLGVTEKLRLEKVSSSIPEFVEAIEEKLD